MANRKQYKILKQGVDSWNKWRKKNMKIKVNLRGANLGITALNRDDRNEPRRDEVREEKHKICHKKRSKGKNMSFLMKIKP